MEPLSSHAPTFAYKDEEACQALLQGSLHLCQQGWGGVESKQPLSPRLLTCPPPLAGKGNLAN